MSAAASPFILFAQARSGSSNLLRALWLHPDVRAADEPFHAKHHVYYPGEPQYISRIRDVPSLEQQLTELFAKYNGFKTLDYQLPTDIYAHLLLKPEMRVIDLRRRNLLQRVVSGFIAEQTGIWQSNVPKDQRVIAYKTLQPIEIRALKKRMRHEDQRRQYYQRVLSKKPSSLCLHVEYESLYTTELEQNRQAMRAVFAFLGLSLPDSPKLDALLNPGVAKINSADMYAFLPNAEEIDRKLGSDRTGWLLKKTP